MLRSLQTSIFPWFPRNCCIERENKKCRTFIGDFLLYPFKGKLRAVSIRYRDLQRPPRKWGTKQNKGCYKFLSNFFQCPKENLGKESVVFVPLSAFQSDQRGWVVGRLAVEPTISHTTPHLALLLRLKPVTLSTREESHTESVNELSPNTGSRTICVYHECGLLSSHAPIRTNYGLIFSRTYHLKISIIEVLLHTFEKIFWRQISA